MFEESRFIKMIRKGDLGRLEKFLEKNPSFLTATLYDSTGLLLGDALNVAIDFNQPEIIKYLVTKRDINLKEDSTALNRATIKGSYEAAVALLELGANPKRRNIGGYDAYEFATDPRLQELLLPYHQELLQEEKLADEQAAEVRIAGTWTFVSPKEVAHQHQPEGQKPITDIFNFSTRRMASIAAGSKNSQQPLNVVPFDKIPDKDTVIAQASAQLKKLTAQQHL